MNSVVLRRIVRRHSYLLALLLLVIAVGVTFSFQPNLFELRVLNSNLRNFLTASANAELVPNRLFVDVVNGQLLGVFAFILGVDPTYQVIEDGAWLNDTLPYGTIHRLASSGKSKGVASAVIEWCLEHCQSLRADTHADNQIMQHLLEKNGFTRCGIIHVADGTPRIAYQKLALTQQHS